MRKIAAAALAAALLAPVTAVEAKPKPDRGPSADRGPASGHGHGAPRADSERRRGHGRSRRCARVQRVGFAVRGTLAAHDADTVTLNVVEANRHARRWLEANPPTFALAGARVKFEGVTDADSSGTVGFEDVAPTDVVKVTGKLARPKRGCEGDQALSVRKVAVERPAAADAPDDAETE